MCIPHGAKSSKNNGYEKVSKPKKHIVSVSKEEFEHGDPDFIDERIIPYEPKHKKSFFESLFSDE